MGQTTYGAELKENESLRAHMGTAAAQIAKVPADISDVSEITGQHKSLSLKRSRIMGGDYADYGTRDRITGRSCRRCLANIKKLARIF